MAELRATKRNPLLGLLADALSPVADYLSTSTNPLEDTGSDLSVTGLLGDTIRPVANTVNRMSYGEPLTTGRGMTTQMRPDTRDALLAVSPMGAGTKAAGRGVKAGAQALSPQAERMLMDLVAKQGGVKSIVPPNVAMQMKMQTNLPTSSDFISAVQGTPGARISDEGLYLNVQRNQKPEQSGADSVRTGVFYLPQGSAQAKYYSKGDAGYGGTEKIAGETLVRNPMFVKGATGGKAPEEAYKQMVGKENFTQMQNDIMSVLNSRQKDGAAYNFLDKYAPEIADSSWYIVQNSKQGNQLRYALQEAVIANEARKRGFDSVLGFSKGRGEKGNFISELFDVRESMYPTKQGDFGLNEQFQGLLD